MTEFVAVSNYFKSSQPILDAKIIQVKYGLGQYSTKKVSHEIEVYLCRQYEFYQKTWAV